MSSGEENILDTALGTPSQIEKTPELAIKIGCDFDIVLGKYYAIFYEERFYIGRAIEYDKKGKNIKLKLLKEELGVYKWPRRDDVDNVHKNRILFGPITLSGNNPFKLKRSELLLIKSKSLLSETLQHQSCAKLLSMSKIALVCPKFNFAHNFACAK